MRSNKLVPALAASAAALCALAPAGASAATASTAGHHGLRHAKRRAANPLGGCRLNLNAAPRFIESGETTLVFGQLTCPTGVSASEQTVTIFARSTAPGSPAAAAVGTAQTDATGNYQLPTAALSTNTQFYASTGSVQSGHRVVKASPKVTLTGPPDGAQLYTGGGPSIRAHLRRLGLSNKVTFSGTVSPLDKGATVALQRESSVGGEEWRRIDASTVGEGGAYSITHTFAVPGDANIRVIVRSGKQNAPGASESFSYEISQAQNPDLTIESSADPIAIGQQTTISGKLTTSAPTALTLLARTRLQHEFVPVASTTSAADGSYTFAAQAPTQSTFYKVSGGGKVSSRLFEGVRYGLTAAASTTSVEQGQEVLFSGTVTPGHTGQPVYLQAQNGSGVGFHLVEIGQVSSASTYSFAHALYATGTHKLRVKVPGNSENQGIASQLFSVEVTPAPAATLKPEAPTNSAQPSEGHF